MGLIRTSKKAAFALLPPPVRVGDSPLFGDFPTSSWYEPTSVLDYDIENGRAYWNGTDYSDEAAFLTAIGGSQDGITRTIGAYEDPEQTNWLTNGDFAADVDGWTAGGTGASIAWASGELELTANGSLNLFYQLVSGTLGKAFKFTGTGRRGTTLNDVQFRAASDVSLSIASEAIPSTGSLISSTSPTTKEGYISGRSNLYVGGRNTSGTGTGTALFDNLSLVEAMPFDGWDTSGFAVAIQAKTAASPSADEVLWQVDTNSENSRVRIVRDISDKHLRVRVMLGGTTQITALDLGDPGDNEDFEIALSAAQANFAASLNGGAPKTSLAGVCPGVSHMRIGRSFTGNTWTGSIERVTVF